jgi:small-conductance mechanosensitive channel
MIKQVKLACDEAKISIPFPQRGIYIVSQSKDAA